MYTFIYIIHANVYISIYIINREKECVAKSAGKATFTSVPKYVCVSSKRV